MSLSKKGKAIIIVVIVAIIGAVCIGFLAKGNLSGTVTDGLTIVAVKGDRTIKFKSIEDALAMANAERHNDVTVSFGQDYKASGKLQFKERTKPLTINLQGHTISRDDSDFVDSGEVFSFSKKGNFTIMNGTISGGKSNNNGGAIWIGVDDVKLTLDNVTITGNETKEYGGGIYAEACYATVRIIDSTITKNTSGQMGGGIFAKYERRTHADFIFEGKTVIKDNEGSNDDDNVIIHKDSYPSIMDISGLQEGAEIVFAYTTHDAGAFEVTLSGKDSKTGEARSISVEDAAKYLVSDISNAKIQSKDGKLQFVPTGNCVATVKRNGGDTLYYTNFPSAWQDANRTTHCDVTMTMYANWDGNYYGFGEGEGFSYGALYPLDRSTWLTLDCNGHIINRQLYQPREHGHVFYFNNDCKMIIKNGTIMRGYCDGRGGGIFLNDKDVELVLDHVTLTENKSKQYGTAICFERKASLTLRDTTITNNYFYGDGYQYAKGAVAYNHGHMTFDGVVKIYDNSGATNSMNDLYMLENASLISGCENLKSDSKIYISSDDGYSVSVTTELGNLDVIKNYFKCTPNSKNTIVLEKNKIRLYMYKS